MLLQQSLVDNPPDKKHIHGVWLIHYTNIFHIHRFSSYTHVAKKGT